MRPARRKNGSVHNAGFPSTGAKFVIVLCETLFCLFTSRIPHHSIRLVRRARKRTLSHSHLLSRKALVFKPARPFARQINETLFLTAARRQSHPFNALNLTRILR